SRQETHDRDGAEGCRHTERVAGGRPRLYALHRAARHQAEPDRQHGIRSLPPPQAGRIRVGRGARVRPTGYLSSAKGMLASQSDRIRAAALSRRTLSRATAYSASAARSAPPPRPCVGETQAVGQRVIPLVRINSAIALALSSSAKISSGLIGISWVQCIISLTLLVYISLRYVTASR